MADNDIREFACCDSPRIARSGNFISKAWGQAELGKCVVCGQSVEITNNSSPLARALMQIDFPDLDLAKTFKTNRDGMLVPESEIEKEKGND